MADSPALGNGCCGAGVGRRIAWRPRRPRVRGRPIPPGLAADGSRLAEPRPPTGAGGAVTLLAIGARRTPAALAALTQVLDAELLIGLPPNTYKLTLADVGALVPQALSTRTVDWLLDLLEVLINHPAADRLAQER